MKNIYNVHGRKDLIVPQMNYYYKTRNGDEQQMCAKRMNFIPNKFVRSFLITGFYFPNLLVRLWKVFFKKLSYPVLTRIYTLLEEG